MPTTRNDSYASIQLRFGQLHGKYVLVTGAARGLGRSMALSYARAGAAGIALLDLCDPGSVKQEIEALTLDPRPEVLALSTDVTDEASVHKAVEAVDADFGQVDILVNNAGVIYYAPIRESKIAPWWKSFEVNVKGLFLMVQAFLPLLVKGSDKTIVTISSIGAHVTIPGGSSYETTKLTVLRITDYINLELGGDGILAYALAPGGVKTDMADGFPSQHHDKLTDTPQLVADTLVFLTSERREWLRGRYVDSRWDMQELLAKREEIENRDLLKIRMAV